MNTSEIKPSDAQDCIAIITENLEKLKGEHDIEVDTALAYWKNTVEFMTLKAKE